MRLHSRADQVRHRAEVLAPSRQDPRPSLLSMARTVGVSKATVQSIIKNFKDREDELEDKPRRPRRLLQTKRWKMCVYTFLGSF